MLCGIVIGDAYTFKISGETNGRERSSMYVSWTERLQYFFFHEFQNAACSPSDWFLYYESNHLHLTSVRARLSSEIH